MKSRRLEIAEDMLKRYSGDKAEDVAGACHIIARHILGVTGKDYAKAKIGQTAQGLEKVSA